MNLCRGQRVLTPRVPARGPEFRAQSLVNAREPVGAWKSLLNGGASHAGG